MTEDKKSLNKFLSEWMQECWHPNWDYIGFDEWRCTKCKKISENIRPEFSRPDYTTEDGFWILWRAAQKSESWPKFLIIETQLGVLNSLYWTKLIDPPVFAESWAKFLGWKEVEE